MTDLISPEILREHRARWFVYAGGYGQPTEKIRHTATMRGSWAGWDVECSCGEWASNTGGAIKARVAEALEEHRIVAEQNAEIAAAGYDPSDPIDVLRYYRPWRD